MLCRRVLSSINTKCIYSRYLLNGQSAKVIPAVRFCSQKMPENKEDSKQTPPVELTRVQKLRKAVTEYGSTVIVFHITISTISLGASYLLVSSGLDVNQVYITLGLSEWVEKSTLMTNAGTFAVAYGLHKMFAPVRISITLASAPFIVRYLRNAGILRK